MPPKTPKPSSGDLFRMVLVNIIDQNHELVRLPGLIDWERFDEAFGATNVVRVSTDSRSSGSAAFNIS